MLHAAPLRWDDLCSSKFEITEAFSIESKSDPYYLKIIPLPLSSLLPLNFSHYSQIILKIT